MDCPNCAGALSDAKDATPGLRPRPPRLGDLGICGGCGAAFILEPAGVRVLTDAELPAHCEPRVLTALAQIRRGIRQ